jgi:ABC-type oligopeptide transport system ATPase subunit
MEEQSEISVPSWLEEPPSQTISPPVQTRHQELPFGKLAWEDFERLCVRLARLEANVEHCQLYGERGDDQAGIDLYARKTLAAKYTVYQCKREKNFGPAKIEAAVTKFLEGEWVEQTDTFILCTQESLKLKQRADAFKTQSEVLRQKGISFICWDSDELSIKLKAHPKIVDDFFGRAWVVAFCGEVQVESLDIKTREDSLTQNYRVWLIDKTSRFVVPGLPEQFSITTDWIPLSARCIQGDKEPFKAELITELYNRCVVVGDSGSGKSTLIRRLANYLANTGKQVLLVRLPDVLRLWRQSKTFGDAILDVSTDGLNIDQSSSRLALSNPDYLFADGLDECNAERANVAEQIKAWAGGHPATKIIVTNRIGYESELLPCSIQVKIQALNKENLLKFASKLLAASLTEKTKFAENIALFEGVLQDDRIFLLMKTNPLLLGFIVQLLKSDVNISQKNRAELYKAVIDLACDHLPQYREPIEFNKRSAKRILEISGWKLLHQPLLTEDELMEDIIRELQEKGYTLQQSESEAEKGISFWENRRILARSKLGHRNIINFVHLSLCDYAAGQYASQLKEADLQTWVQEVRQDIKWRETIYFTSGLGAGEKIARYLLELDNSRDLSSKEALLAVAATVESNKISSELLEAVVNRIQPRLESSSPAIIFEATNVLLSMLPKAAKFIGGIAESLLANTQLWTRIAAMRLALACYEENIDLDDLKQIISEIISEPVIPNLPFLISSKRKCTQYEWNIRNSVILYGCKLLLKKQNGIETANQILQFISQRSLSSGPVDSVKKLLMNYILENLKLTELQEDKKEWYSLLRELTRHDQPFEEFNSPQTTLKELQTLEQTRCGDRAFSEAIIRTVGMPIENKEHRQASQDLVALGILVKGMGWREMPTTAWDILSERTDTEAVDIVLKGMIAVLDIPPQRLTLEAFWMLEDINRFFSFDLASIKAVLQTGQISEEYLQKLEFLKEVYKDESASQVMYHQIPRVPVAHKWERAAHLHLSPEVLAHALEHPSQGICQNAALLIKHGAGGHEAIELAKSIVGEDEWQAFEEM